MTIVVYFLYQVLFVVVVMILWNHGGDFVVLNIVHGYGYVVFTLSMFSFSIFRSILCLMYIANLSHERCKGIFPYAKGPKV